MNKITKRPPLGPKGGARPIGRAPIKIEDILKKTAKRLDGISFDPNYSFQKDMDDLKNLRSTVSKIALRQFDWGLATYLRAHDNRGLPKLEQRIAEQLDKRPNANRTMMHGLFYLAGVQDRTTVSMWAKAAEFVLPQIESTEDIQRVLKKYGGPRKCADRARGHIPDNLGDDSSTPTTPRTRDNGGKGTSGHAEANMDEDASPPAGKACKGPRNPSLAERHKTNKPWNKSGGTADLPYVHFELPDEVHGAFRSLLAGDATDAVVRVTHCDSKSVTVTAAVCVSATHGENLMDWAKFEE